MKLPKRLDLGVAQVAVQHDPSLDERELSGLYHYDARILSVNPSHSAATQRATLIHEVLHVWDKALFGEALQNLKGGCADSHEALDVLATCIDQFLERNWAAVKALYETTETRARRSGRSRKRAGTRGPRRRGAAART